MDRAKYLAEYPLPVDPAGRVSGQYRAGAARQYSTVDPASIPPEQLVRAACQSSSPVWFCLMSRPARSWVYISCWCLRVLSTLNLGKGDAFVLLWVVNEQLRLIPRWVSFWKGLGFCERNQCLSSRDRLADKGV